MYRIDANLIIWHNSTFNSIVQSTINSTRAVTSGGPIILNGETVPLNAFLINWIVD